MQELFSNNLKKFPNMTSPILPFATLGEQKMKRKSADSERRPSAPDRPEASGRRLDNRAREAKGRGGVLGRRAASTKNAVR